MMYALSRPACCSRYYRVIKFQVSWVNDRYSAGSVPGINWIQGLVLV